MKVKVMQINHLLYLNSSLIMVASQKTLFFQFFLIFFFFFRIQTNYFSTPGIFSLSITALKVPDIEQNRAPMDFICLVDTSKSMQGGFSLTGKNKLAQVLSCFKHLLTYLTPSDRLSIFLFALNPQKLFGLVAMDTVRKWKIYSALSDVVSHPEGGTNILRAVEAALIELVKANGFEE
jgi:hypothetical protein